MDGWMDAWIGGRAWRKRCILLGLVVLLLGAELYDLNFGALVPYRTTPVDNMTGELCLALLLIRFVCL
jgi:hypothetical protein